MKILIVGGVAGGASAATRARRVNSQAEITILEKGPVVSFANCGLPYHIGGEIADRKKLLVATPELFWNRFRIEVKSLHEAIEIDRSKKLVKVLNRQTSQTELLAYDRLILATGSEPITPSFCDPMPSNAFHLWTLNDMDQIISRIKSSGVKKAVVIGGGFVGLEVVEQLAHIGIQVTLIERNEQVLKPMDVEFARMIENHMRSKGVEVLLSTDIRSIKFGTSKETADRAESLVLGCGKELELDLLIVGAGIRPRVGLAKSAGLAIGSAGGVTVNSHLQTNDPEIYAVGDMVELQHGVLNEPVRIPLAGSANRAGRVAGEHAATGKADPIGSVLGTSIVRVFDLTAGCTGLNERALNAKKIAFRSVIIQAAQHASYYPGAKSLQLKLLYTPEEGRILGAQAIGADGVDKRIDVLATAIHFQANVRQLSQLDLAYAPPFGSAKDPIHMAAFAACNDLDHAPNLVRPDEDLTGKQVVDVRTPKEQADLPLPGAIPIEVDHMIDKWKSLDPKLPTVVVCHSGKRAHVSACWLRGQGFGNVSNLSGGMSIRSLVVENKTAGT